MKTIIPSTMMEDSEQRASFPFSKSHNHKIQLITTINQLHKVHCEYVPFYYLTHLSLPPFDEVFLC